MIEDISTSCSPCRIFGFVFPGLARNGQRNKCHTNMSYIYTYILQQRVRRRRRVCSTMEAAFLCIRNIYTLYKHETGTLNCFNRVSIISLATEGAATNEATWDNITPSSCTTDCERQNNSCSNSWQVLWCTYEWSYTSSRNPKTSSR